MDYMTLIEKYLALEQRKMMLARFRQRLAVRSLRDKTFVLVRLIDQLFMTCSNEQEKIVDRLLALQDWSDFPD